jgi:hypothetical protein
VNKATKYHEIRNEDGGWGVKKCTGSWRHCSSTGSFIATLAALAPQHQLGTGSAAPAALAVMAAQTALREGFKRCAKPVPLYIPRTLLICLVYCLSCFSLALETL